MKETNILLYILPWVHKQSIFQCVEKNIFNVLQVELPQWLERDLIMLSTTYDNIL